MASLPLIPIFQSIILLILIQPPPYLSSNDYDRGCNNMISCGNIRNIGFPFWGDNRPQGCGHPLLHLLCEKDKSYITIKDVKYQVLEADPIEHTMKIARVDYLEGLCPSKLVNTSLDTELFVYGSEYKNLTLFYGCTASQAFPCGPNGAFSDQNVYPQFWPFSLSTFCKSSVVVPVSPLLVDISDFNKIQNAIIDGFVVRWIEGVEECERCQNSGGVCWYNWNSHQTNCSIFLPDVETHPQSQVPSPPPGKSSSSKVPVAIGAGVGAVALVGFICCVFFFMRRKRKIADKSRSQDLFMPPPSGEAYTSTTNTFETLSSFPSYKSETMPKSFYFGVQVFNYDELQEATKNFDPSRELGEGGFGTVYKGELKDGRVVAVKRLYESSFKRVEQFMNEVEILARLRHKNLVTLFGCTSRHSRELLLVYEFIPNGTVSDHLQGRRSNSSLLPWPVRLNIAVETAEALAYLHASDVIHRDVKSNNILLDDKFRVKVADFGLSRLFPNHVTHVSTAPQGTPGYVDPEYYQCYQLTDKSDVYSFGVVLVELISSLQAVDVNRTRSEVNLANMAVNKIQNQELHELVDPYLGFERDHAIRSMTTAVAELAFRCLQQQREMRPPMDEVLEVLRGIKSGELGAKEEAAVVDIRTEEVIPLKKVPSPVSPDSVVDKWVSGSSVSNSS